MPQDIPKPIARKRKPAAALKVSAPVKQAEPLPNGSISQTGHGIAALAQELAALQALCTMMSNAGGPAKRAQKKQAAEDCQAEEHAKCCQAALDIEDVGRRSHEMVDALEALILTLEPTTPSETLSLALVLAQEFDVFLGNHTDPAVHAVDLEKQQLEDALRAIIRGLVHGAGASSPLLDAYTGRGTLIQWDAACHTAARAAARYVAREVEASQ